MEYNLSLAEFQSGKMFDSNRKFIHKLVIDLNYFHLLLSLIVYRLKIYLSW